MPANISTPEGLLEGLSAMGNFLKKLVAENEKLKGSQGNAVGVRKVIQSGNKELVPKKFVAVGHNGSFRSSAREVEDYARIAHPATLEQFKIGERTENNDDFAHRHSATTRESRPGFAPFHHAGFQMERQRCSR